MEFHSLLPGWCLEHYKPWKGEMLCIDTAKKQQTPGRTPSIKPLTPAFIHSGRHSPHDLKRLQRSHFPTWLHGGLSFNIHFWREQIIQAMTPSRTHPPAQGTTVFHLGCLSRAWAWALWQPAKAITEPVFLFLFLGAHPHLLLAVQWLRTCGEIYIPDFCLEKRINLFSVSLPWPEVEVNEWSVSLDSLSLKIIHFTAQSQELEEMRLETGFFWLKSQRQALCPHCVLERTLYPTWLGDFLVFVSSTVGRGLTVGDDEGILLNKWLLSFCLPSYYFLPPRIHSRLLSGRNVNSAQVGFKLGSCYLCDDASAPTGVRSVCGEKPWYSQFIKEEKGWLITQTQSWRILCF